MVAPALAQLPSRRAGLDAGHDHAAAVAASQRVGPADLVGEPVGFRMNAINPATDKRDRATELVVHLNFAGKTIDLPMRDRQNERQPEREFWVAKWIVPDDAPMGIVRYTVTAKDPQGRTGEFKPFEVQASQITIVP